MTFFGKTRSVIYARDIRQRAEAYSSSLAEQDRLAVQLQLWNNEWQRLSACVPYFRSLSQKLHLPSLFRSWQEFADSVPITTRAMVQENYQEMISEGRKPDSILSTGGSTAQPIRIPSWKTEKTLMQPNRWLARSWYGITPASRIFLLWGHSHLFGTGVKGSVNANKRKLFDRLLGYYRFSAYDLQPDALHRAAKKLIGFRPDYMIGYSMGLDLFARANDDVRDALRAVGMKVVIGTAESFPTPDSASLLSELFGCPVAMEYGSVETGVIAHTHPSGGYHVFWRSYFIEAEREHGGHAGLKVRVTSLYPRCFPLVRYEIGDEIEIWDHESNSVIGVDTFKTVIGRCNEYVPLGDGTVLHSEVFTHAVRACQEILSYQVVQEGTAIHIHYTSHDSLPDEQIAQIRWRLSRVNPSLAQVNIQRVDRLQRTVAGKTPMVIKW